MDLKSITDTIEEINKINPKFKNLLALNQKQTADILGVSVSTLENWRAEKIGIEWIKTGNEKRGKILYPKIKIAEYLSNTVEVMQK